jgi:1-acyl-sn-glycerol-3-phosphate acyltransferase
VTQSAPRAESASERAARTGRVDPAAAPRISPWLLRWFRWYSRRYLSRHFHAVRLARAGRPEDPAETPLVVFLNHAAWWDPLVGLCLAEAVFPNRAAYAPIEAKALGRYRFMERVGLFGIDPGTRQGAVRFLRVAQAVLAMPNAALWITPEGRFADPRQRPVRLEPGLAHLARRMQRGVLLPLALEYPFWEERFPEALARFGDPVRAEEHRGLHLDGWNVLLAAHLEAAQDALAGESIGREANQFDVVIRGSAGVGGVYDLWRRMKARLRGQRFRPEHGEDDR